MRRLLYTLLSLWLVSTAQAQQNQAYLQYIDKYASMAVDQMKRYHIPASITLAQGLLESDAGRSRLATKANNHFGIKCHGWSGGGIYHDDDRPQECFRKYRNAAASFEDHSIFLTQGERYEFLFKYDQTDYKAWAKGLKKAGYATDPEYANRLIKLIETYGLSRYDKKQKKVKGKSAAQEPHQPYLSNGLLYVMLQDGEVLKDLSREFDISRHKLRSFNEIDRSYVPQDGSIIYLERKKNKAAKQYRTHVVQPDESLWSISQLYGIKMKAIIRKNKLGEDNPLYVGMPLRVR